MLQKPESGFYNKTQLVTHISKELGIPLTVDDVELSLPIPQENHPKNTKILLTIKQGHGLKPRKVTYCYDREVFNGTFHVIKVLYKDEEESADVIRQALNEAMAVYFTEDELPHHGAKIKDLLAARSPYGEVKVTVEGYRYYFTGPILVYLHPDKLDAKYLINDIATRVKGQVVYSLDREMEDDTPRVGETLKQLIAGEHYGRTTEKA